MQLEDRLNSSGTALVRLVDGWYEIEEDGWSKPMPVLHYHGRTEGGDYHHFAVDGYRPYFCIAAEDTNDEELASLAADRRVLDISHADRSGITRGETEIDLLRVTVVKPWQVKQLRSEFDRTWEADVRFTQRFLIDRGVTSYCRVPAGETRLSASDVTAVDIDAVDEPIEPRVAFWDIEVQADEFPEPKSPTYPITAVTLYDSYKAEYASFVLREDEWDCFNDEESLNGFGVDGVMRVFDDERELIRHVVTWLTDVRPDLLSGWNSNSFDWPYFVNRSFYLDEMAVKQISPTRNVEEHEKGGRWVNGDVTGVHLFDLLEGYKKSQYTELKSHTLEDVAAEETDIEKLDVDEQTAWLNDPEAFVEYNVRDVEACVAINKGVNLV